MTVRPPTPSQLREAAAELRLDLTERELDDYGRLIGRALTWLDPLDSLPEELPEVRVPRTPGRRPRPEEDPYNAWCVKTSIKGDGDGILSGRRVVLKDNVCLAGVPMSMGSSIFDGYVPEVDATIVTRILDAGGEIAGKARCESFSRSGASWTGPGEPIQNPHRLGYTTGGSSSGCAAIVASGEVTMAIGADQAGSIRLPCHFCGIVGLKPTWGLVPYTGIAPLEYSLDHAGPMTATVAESALLLEAIAGLDEERDPRQYRPEVARYTERLDAGARGLRIGVLAEGFGLENSEPDVDEAVRDAASRLAGLGATVEQVSIPEHRLGLSALMGIFMQGNLDLMKADTLASNCRGLYLTGLGAAFAAWRQRANELSEGLKLELLAAEHVERVYRRRYYAKAQNLATRLRRVYDDALGRYDVLLMPTGPYKAWPLPGPGAPVEERLAPGLELTVNTGPFNCTGHPALSVPCGSGDGLPIGMMLVGRWYGESTLFQAAAAFERVPTPVAA